MDKGHMTKKPVHVVGTAARIGTHPPALIISFEVESVCCVQNEFRPRTRDEIVNSGQVELHHRLPRLLNYCAAPIK